MAESLIEDNLEAKRRKEKMKNSKMEHNKIRNGVKSARVRT